MATKRQAKIFRDKVLPKVGGAASNGKPLGGNVTGFLAQEGCLYSDSDRLMVVGRAVDGFLHDIDPVEFNCPDFRAEYTNVLWQRRDLPDGNCPMKWVEERFNYEGDWSAFWGVIRRVAIGLEVCEPERTDWPSHLTWSNLYKVSPAEGGDPKKTLCKIQYEGCKELLKCEFQDYCPRFLLFLTEKQSESDRWARPFLNDLDLNDLELCDWQGGQYVCFTGRMALPDCASETRIVGLVHPGRKRGGRPVIADEILSAFKR